MDMQDSKARRLSFCLGAKELENSRRNRPPVFILHENLCHVPFI